MEQVSNPEGAVYCPSLAIPVRVDLESVTGARGKNTPQLEHQHIMGHQARAHTQGQFSIDPTTSMFMGRNREPGGNPHGP